MKANKIIFLIIFLANSLLAQILSTLSASVEYSEDYFPFNENVELIFESNVGETETSVERLDSLYKLINVSDDFIYSRTFLKKDNGIFLHRTEQKISTFFYSTEVEITYSEPVLQFPLPISVGDIWNWSGYQMKNGDTTEVSIIGEAIGEEKVELPAGKFNTLKIKVLFEEKDGEKTTLYQWFAPGVGSVKTKVIIEGKGIIQFAMSLLGYDEIDSELKEIRHLE